MKLQDKVALVTGGASGLGRATVEALLAGGARVVIADLAHSPGETVAKELGDAVRFAATDVTAEPDVQAAVQTAVREFGGLHVAVSCAGIGWAQRTVDKNGPHSLDVFRKVIEVNLIGTFNVTRLAAAQMVQQEPIEGERGVIVNTASIAAYDGQIGQVAYASSKGVGRALVSGLEDRLRAADGWMLVSWSSGNDKDAIAWHRAIGFEDGGRIEWKMWRGAPPEVLHYKEL